MAGLRTKLVSDWEQQSKDVREFLHALLSDITALYVCVFKSK